MALRPRTPRTHARIGIALAAALAATVIAGAPAFAGNTRTVFFGSPNTASQLPPGLGVLTTTDVTAGGATATDVILQNLSPSQLTHVVIQGGSAAPDPLANPSFPAPPPICTTTNGVTTCLPSLPPDMTYAKVYVDPSSTAATTCSFTGTSLSCTVANMSTNQFARIRVVLQPSTTANTQEQFWLATSLKEGTSNTGQNQDTFFAYGTFNVLTPGCGEIANFFNDQTGVQIANNQAGACDQTSNISARNADFSLVKFSQGAFSSTGSTDTNNTWCSGLGLKSCFGVNSTANVNFGVNPSGTYVLWDIVWGSAVLGNGKPTGVVHFLDGYDPVKNPNAFVLIPFKGNFQCKTATQTNCWVSNGSITGGFEAVFRTPNNGTAHGY